MTVGRAGSLRSFLGGCCSHVHARKQSQMGLDGLVVSSGHTTTHVVPMVRDFLEYVLGVRINDESLHSSAGLLYRIRSQYECDFDHFPQPNS